MRYQIALFVAALCLTGCDSASHAQEGDEPSGVNLVDTQIPAATDDEPNAWEYRRSARADLDADGTPERVVLLANVALTDGGEPVWDDGQAWEVHVEEADGRRTRLYARFLQFGTLEATVVETDGGPAVFLVEKTPFAVAAYEVRYGGPGTVHAVEIAARSIESLLTPEE